VLSAGPAAAIVALGDSITEGACSSFDANGDWPDLLAGKLPLLPDGTAVSVLNAGIGSGRFASSAIFSIERARAVYTAQPTSSNPSANRSHNGTKSTSASPSFSTPTPTGSPAPAPRLLCVPLEAQLHEHASNIFR
jgi:hypothetical protein